jgi:hypothetical protein
MSRRTVRRVTVAVALVLALSLAGPATAATGAFEVAVPAVQSASWLDLFVEWLGGLWGGQAATSTDKTTIVPTGETGTQPASGNSSNPNSTTREQGGMIDPDG